MLVSEHANVIAADNDKQRYTEVRASLIFSTKQEIRLTILPSFSVEITQDRPNKLVNVSLKNSRTEDESQVSRSFAWPMDTGERLRDEYAPRMVTTGGAG